MSEERGSTGSIEFIYDDEGMPIPVVKPKRVQQQHSLSMSISNLVGKETTADFETRGDHHASNIIMDFPHTPVAPTVDTEDSSPDAVSHAILSSSPAEANHAELSVGDNNVAGTTTTAKHKHRKDKAGSSSKIRRRRHHEGERQEGESNSRRREHHNEEGEGQGGEQAITSRKHHRSGQSHRHYRSHRRHEEEDSQGAHPVSTNEDDGTSAASKSINLHHDEDNNLNNNNNNNTPKIAAHNIRNDLFPPIHGLIPRQQDTLANNHQPHEQQQSHLAAVGGGTAAKKQAFRPSSVYVATASNVQPSIQEETTLTTEWKEGLVPFEESPHHHQQQHHHHYSNNSNINNNLRPSATLRSPGAVSQDVISDANNYMSRGAGGGISQQLQQPTPTQHADSKLAINTTNNGNVFPSSLKQNRPDGSGGELSLRQQQQYSERDLISKQQQVRYNSSNGGVALLGGKKVSKSSLVSDNASERGISMNPATRKSTITANEALTAIKNVLKPPPPSNINPYSGKIKENGLTRRMLGNRQVMLWYAEDVELFDIIKNWKTVYPDKTEEQVLSEFGDRSTTGSLDSITKIICRPKGYWDYIMKFSTGDNRHTVRNVFDVCLLRAGLFLEIDMENGTTEYFLKIITPFHVLCKVAEVYDLQLPLKKPEIPIPSSVNARLNFNWLTRLAQLCFAYTSDEQIDLNLIHAPFRRADYLKFKGLDRNLPTGVAQSRFFKTTFRSLLTYYLIYSIRIKYNSIPRVKLQGLSYFESVGIYSKTLHTHERRSNESNESAALPTLRDHLIKSWGALSFWKPKPLEDVREYFGERIAIYFAFMLFYRDWCLIMGVFGLIVFFYGVAQYTGSPNGEPGSLQLMLNYNDVNNTTTTATMPTGDATPWRVLYDNDLTFYYAILTSIMSALFTGFWKRRANHLSYLWATASTTKEPLTRRHEFRPTSTFVSPITGLVEPQFPRSRRMLRHFLSWIVLILFLVVICASVFAQFIVAGWLLTQTSASLTAALVGFAGGLLVAVIKLIYSPVILALTNYENHEFTQTHSNSLLFKRWILDFANIFSRLLYFAFFRPYFSQASNFGDYSLSYGCNGECTTDLFIQFLILFIGDMGYTSFNSNIMPIAVHLSRRNKRNSVEPLNEEHLEADERGNIKSSSVPQFVIDDKLQSLASNNERELEYLSVTIQYGLISSFSIIFPLAPILAGVDITSRLHFTAYKLLIVYQRPPPLRAKDIDLSLSYLGFSSLFGASLNAALVTFQSRAFQDKYLAPNWDAEYWLSARFGIFASWNVALFLMMHVFKLLVPKVSETISTAKLRAQYLERYSFEKDLIEDGNDEQNQ